MVPVSTYHLVEFSIHSFQLFLENRNLQYRLISVELKEEVLSNLGDDENGARDYFKAGVKKVRIL